MPLREGRGIGTRILVFAAALVVAMATAGCLVVSPRDGDLRSVPTGDVLRGDYVALATNTVFAVSYGPDPRQVFDVHVPPGGSPTPLPVVVYLHSGGWIAGGRTFIPQVLLRQVTRARVALVSVDYRLAALDDHDAPVDTFPTADQDVDRAIRNVKAHAATWNLDPNRVIVAGASAGGHLAVLAGVAPGEFVAPDLPPELQTVAPNVLGVLDWVGPSDFSTFAQAGGWAPGLMTAFLGCPMQQPDLCAPATVTAASAASHLDASDPPAYLVYGRDDSLAVASTQGLPLAVRWAAARGEFALPDVVRGVRYEVAADDHDVTPDHENVRQLEVWLDQVLAGVLR